MKKLVFLLCIALVAFTGCSNENIVKYNNVEDRLKTEGLDLTESKDKKIANFAIPLQNTDPRIYELNNSNFLYVYVFDSVDQRKKANSEYIEKNNNSELITQVKFQKKNVIVFYVFTKDKSKDIENSVKTVVDDL